MADKNRADDETEPKFPDTPDELIVHGRRSWKVQVERIRESAEGYQFYCPEGKCVLSHSGRPCESFMTSPSVGGCAIYFVDALSSEQTLVARADYCERDRSTTVILADNVQTSKNNLFLRGSEILANLLDWIKPDF